MTHAQDKQEVDVNGFLTVPFNPISRAGVFQYLGANIPGAPDPAAVYSVYRPADELAHPDAIASFCLLPIVDDHTMLGDGHTPAEIKGVHGTTSDDVQLVDGVLLSTLRIFSDTLRQKIERKEKVDLSLGYRCRYDATPGNADGVPYQYIQRDLRGNHLALVDKARCDVYVLDGITFETTGGQQMAEETNLNDPKEGGSGELTISQLAETVKAIAGQVAQVMEVVTALQSLAPKAAPHVEPDGDEVAEVDGGSGNRPTKPVAMDAVDMQRAIMADIKARDVLVSQLVPLVGAFDHADMTAQDVAKYGVTKLGLTVKEGAEAPALAGYLAGSAQSSKAVAQDANDVPNVITAYAKGGE